MAECVSHALSAFVWQQARKILTERKKKEAGYSHPCPGEANRLQLSGASSKARKASIDR